MGDATRLIFIRHAQSRAAVDRVIAGHDGCRGLSEAGISQAQALRERLQSTRELQPDVFLSSVLPRAIHTAEIIAPAFGGLGLQRDCDLCELHPGESDGISVADYERRYGFDMGAEPERPMSPGGESLVTFQQRVTACITRLANDHAGQTLVLVCHGGVIIAASLALFGAPGFHQRRPFRLEPENTSITEWVRPIARDTWVLRRFNDCAHLQMIKSPADAKEESVWKSPPK